MVEHGGYGYISQGRNPPLVDAGATLRGLYKVGGVSMFAVTALTFLAFFLFTATPSTTNVTPEKALSSFPSQATFAIASNLDIEALYIFILVGLVALYAALRDTNWGFALTGTMIGAIGLTVSFIGTALSFATPGLSDAYASATATAADKAAYVAANWAISAAGTAIGLVGGVLIGLWILVISWVMLKGMFGRKVAYLGLLVAILLFASTPPFVPFYFFIVAFVLFAVWSAAVGVRLYGLGKAGT